MKVELIYDPSCPNVAEARGQLSEAFAAVKLRTRWIEWNLLDPEAPARVRTFGSPTILVDGKDVSEQSETSAGASCRIYREGGGLRGAPSARTIAAALSRPRRSGMWALLPAVLSSLLPNVACPACWPVYAGMAGSLGFGFLLDATYLLPVIIVSLLIALGPLAWGARTRGVGPAAVGVLGAGSVLLGKFWLDSALIMAAGVAMLMAASVWNSRPHRRATLCTSCAPGTSEV